MALLIPHYKQLFILHFLFNIIFSQIILIIIETITAILTVNVNVNLVKASSTIFMIINFTSFVCASSINNLTFYLDVIENILHVFAIVHSILCNYGCDIRLFFVGVRLYLLTLDIIDILFLIYLKFINDSLRTLYIYHYFRPEIWRS